MTPIDRNFLDVSADTTTSGVSWASIFAGAAAAAALSLILLILGAGLGFSAVSPWANSGVSAATLGTSSIVWLAFTQIVAAGVGGYLAGRLRVKWATVHTDEVYFRDTAHGFLAWALASLVTVALVGSAAGSAISHTASAGATVAGTAVGAVGAAGVAAGSQALPSASGTGSSDSGGMGYAVDSLFRSSQPSDAAAPNDNASRMEAMRIFANGIRAKKLPQEDVQYLGQVIAKRTGLSQADAEKRVNDAFTNTQTAINNAEQNVKQAADNARKVAAYSALWMFVALLCGAFVASLSATFGGKQRDGVVHTQRATVPA